MERIKLPSGKKRRKMNNFQWFYGLAAGILVTMITYGEIGLHWVLFIPIPLGTFLGFLCGVENKREIKDDN